METMAVLQRYAERWLAGDVDALFASYAEDAVFHYYGTSDLAGDHAGRDAVLTVLIAASSRAARELLEIVDVLAGANRGAIVARERLTRDGESHDVTRVFLYRVEGDRIAECWLYDEDQALIDRLWSPPAT
jgi:hypothetical protein